VAAHFSVVLLNARDSTGIRPTLAMYGAEHLKVGVRTLECVTTGKLESALIDYVTGAKL
jgi:hypothetical protein